MIYSKKLEDVNLKIELLQDQIENYEQSGHFTENEMDILTTPIKIELRALSVRQYHLKIMTQLTENTNNKG